MGRSIVISAPSGAGKTSIVNFLLKEINDLEFSVSACNRERRHNEINGEHYYFMATEDFKEKISQNLFLEWEEVYPNQFYGTLLSSVDNIWSEGKNVIFDVDVKGALNIKDKFQTNCLAIFIAPPNIKTLGERLIKRATDVDQNIQTRLAKAEEELQYQDKFDHVIINDDLSIACKNAKELVNNFLGK